MCSASCFSGYDPEARSQPRISSFATARFLSGVQNQAPPDPPSNAFDPYVAQPLVRLARRSNRRDAEDLRRLAPPGLPVLLAPEVPSWPTADSAGAPTLIRRMARENPSWGEERIANELLLKLGLRVSPRTVRKYWPKVPAAPAGNPRRDQRWSTFSSPRVPPIRPRGMTIVV
jgi:hypothetical protein